MFKNKISLWEIFITSKTILVEDSVGKSIVGYFFNSICICSYDRITDVSPTYTYYTYIIKINSFEQNYYELYEMPVKAFCWFSPEDEIC